METSSAEAQYLAILARCFVQGVDVKNERTNSICRTILNQRIQFDGNHFPLLTTRKVNWKGAIGEMLAYMRGYTRLEDFHKLGVKTWDANANNWTSNEVAKLRYGDCGLIYGASSVKVGVSYSDIIQSIKDNPTDRGLIWNFWNSEYFHLGCLRPCMFNHQFNVLEGKLHLTSTQRSQDVPLGGCWNIIQCWFLLNITAKLTNLEVGTITLNISNAHIYENQFEGVIEQLKREPLEPASCIIDKDITLDDVLKNIDKDNIEDYFTVLGYQYHPPIKYPFTA